MSRSWLYAVVGGGVIGTLAWLDPLFIPLVLLGPFVLAAAAWGAARGLRRRRARVS